MQATKTSLGVQTFLGSAMILAGIAGLLRARLALQNHTVMWGHGRLSNWTWLDPWQAMLGYCLAFLVGLFCVIDAIRRQRR
jgi:hypothetical protein